MLVLPFLSCYTEGCSVSLGKTNLCSCLKEPKMTQGYFFILQDTVKGRGQRARGQQPVTELSNYCSDTIKKNTTKQQKTKIEALFSLV